jgi:hypothetical protein
LNRFSVEELESLVLMGQRSLFSRGVFRTIFDETQLAVYEQFQKTTGKIFVFEAARQLGKSFSLVVLAFFTAMSNDGCRVNYCTKTAKMALEIVLPIAAQIAKFMLPGMAPEWRASEGHFKFPNGSTIILFGADDERSADRGRGPRALLNIVDEAGFISILDYLLNSVLIPQTRRTGGRTVLASSTPLSPGHHFCVVADGAAAKGCYVMKDFYSPGLQSLEEKEAYVAECAAARNMTVAEFKETTAFKREFLCQRVVDESLAVVPEFQKVKHDVVRESERPLYFDCYASCDPGMADFTGILFGYYDFVRAKFVLEHELLLERANTATIARTWKEVESTHYESCRFVSRVVDDTHGRICADLSNDHQLDCNPALKDNSEAAVGLMRVWMGARRIEIHPRCSQLIHQLNVAIRNPNTGDMVRTVKDGHFDLVAALKYLVRSIDTTHNPFPYDYDFNPYTQARAFNPPRKPSLGEAIFGNTNIGALGQ